MTQKELLYIEDAIGHEKNIYSILDNIINSLNDNDLIDFLEQEKEKHKKLEESFMNFLEELSNE